MPRLLIAVVIGLAIAAEAQPAAGQETTSCDFDSCSLWVRPGRDLFGGRDLVRGRDGDRLVRLGVFTRDVARFFAANDSALANARMFGRANSRGAALRVASLGALVAGATLIESGTSDGAALGLTVGGIGLGVLGAVQLRRAEAALAQAVWWHNRELYERR